MKNLSFLFFLFLLLTGNPLIAQNLKGEKPVRSLGQEK